MSLQAINEAEKLKKLTLKTISKHTGLKENEIRRAFEGDEISVPQESILKIIKKGYPIEPFLIGFKEFEKIVKEKVSQSGNQGEDFSELLIETAKEKSMPYPLNKEAYEAFLIYRKDVLKKPVTKAGATKQKKLLRSYPLELQECIIKECIDKVWEGLFKPDAQKLNRFKREIEKKRKSIPQEEDKKENFINLTKSEKTSQNDSLSFEEMIDIFE